MNLQCTICGNTFNVRTHNHRYCSAVCRKHAKANTAKLFYRNNREQLRQYDRAFYLRNRDARIVRDREYRRRKMQEDTLYRMRINLRKRLNKAISIGQKRGSAVRDLGCSIEELKIYLESLFLDGMSWNNYGRKIDTRCWEIDHIVPLASFDLTDREQLLKACHYTNLQPMWAKDNWSKHTTDSRETRPEYNCIPNRRE